ncbi:MULTISPECIES: DUF6328 family protein [Kitasatospora]|uniref:DUF6328 family protein n=1 Tax=Kitasatospora cathayae TaxID=3004092 RepID=A0ABY7QEL4_9ACTN|nr:DUF6328 family protein [Kitasatospora sp. HUAS 3-15]WBP91199.1 DUF6328 family protein [Kitasatospora sp. HUAS 3-15]
MENHVMVGESEESEEKADRKWTEMLQEVRVAQTGAQILFGFLISVVFTPRFTQISPADRTLYDVTVVLGAVATGTLIAPVAFHRFLAGHQMMPELVRAGAKMIVLGLVLLGITVGAALVLLLHVATHSPAAWVVAGAVMLWFAICWLVLPWIALRTGKRRAARPGT